jgi:hypothetical protein
MDDGSGLCQQLLYVESNDASHVISLLDGSKVESGLDSGLDNYRGINLPAKNHLTANRNSRLLYYVPYRVFHTITHDIILDLIAGGAEDNVAK